MADSGSIDAFARARVSQHSSLFDGKMISPSGAAKWDDQEVSGSGTSSVWDEDTAEVTLSVGTAAGKRVRQTYNRFNYQPGKSQMILMTFVLGDPVSGITKRVGYYDGNNGIYLRQIGNATQLVIENNGVTTVVTQASWSEDKMDGTGRSGVTLDWTKAQILLIDMEWLGVGRVRVGFVIDGIPVYVHHFNHANNVTGTYMGTPNLPLRYDIDNNGTGDATSMKAICCNVSSEGGQNAIGQPHGIVGVTQSLGDGEVGALAGLRCQTDYNDSVIRLTHITSMGDSSNDIYRVHLCKNPTLGGTPVWADVTGSGMQQLTSVNAVSDLGTILATGIAVSRDSIHFLSQTDFSPGVAIDGTRDELVLVAESLDAGATIRGTINWFEFG